MTELPGIQERLEFLKDHLFGVQFLEGCYGAEVIKNQPRCKFDEEALDHLIELRDLVQYVVGPEDYAYQYEQKFQHMIAAFSGIQKYDYGWKFWCKKLWMIENLLRNDRWVD